MLYKFKHLISYRFPFWFFLRLATLFSFHFSCFILKNIYCENIWGKRQNEMREMEKQTIHTKINKKRFWNNIFIYFHSFFCSFFGCPRAIAKMCQAFSLLYLFCSFFLFFTRPHSHWNILLEFYQSLRSNNVYLSMKIYGSSDSLFPCVYKSNFFQFSFPNFLVRYYI